jgi:hypothetical protein
MAICSSCRAGGAITNEVGTLLIWLTVLDDTMSDNRCYVKGRARDVTQEMGV